MFIRVTTIDEFGEIRTYLNINEIKFFSPAEDETNGQIDFGTIIYLVGEEDSYIHAKEDWQLIIKRIKNATPTALTFSN